MTDNSEKKMKLPPSFPRLIIFAGLVLITTVLFYQVRSKAKNVVGEPYQSQLPEIKASAISPPSPPNDAADERFLLMAKTEMQLLAQEIHQHVRKAIKTKQATRISVYYEDLNTRLAFGIEEEKTFNAASLLKVPLLMATLKRAESDPDLLSHRIKYNDATCPQKKFRQIIASNAPLNDGERYSVEELLYRLIVHSDNSAVCALDTLISDAEVRDVLLTAGLSVSNMTPTATLVTTRFYGALLSMLYHSAYLSPEMSARALQLLTRSEFRDGLIAGVPGNIPVSHKFGEWGKMTESDFHDCGIIYYPNAPYILCVMTEGKNFERLVPIIADLSRTVYNWRSSR